MINILTIFMFVSICVGAFLLAYILINGNVHYMKYLAAMLACVVIYIFGYMIELHSNSLRTALLWNGLQYFAIPVISTLWLIMVLLYVGIVKRVRSWIVLALFIIPAITYVMRLTNSSHFLYYTGYAFNMYGEVGILELWKGPWYYVQQIYGCIETLLVILIFWIRSYMVSGAERRSYRILSLISASTTLSILLILFDPTNLGLDYTAVLFPIPLFLLAYVIAKQDFFEIRSTARNQIFYQSKEAMIILNDKHRVIDYNLKAVEFFEENGIKLTVTDLNMFYDENVTLIETLYSERVEIFQDTFNDGLRYWEISSNMIFAKKGIRHGIIKIIRDITVEYTERQHLEKIAKVDELTQLFNRREFNERAAILIKQSKDKDMPLIMLMFDIDHFKRVNDTFGHQAGDKVLKKIADEASVSFRNDDLLARVGGEEFAVILPGISDSKARLRADRYREKIAAMHFIESDPSYQITISFGMAVLGNQMSLEELMGNADKALYEAKNSGRNKVVKYS